jgi:hypothetical protein
MLETNEAQESPGFGRFALAPSNPQSEIRLESLKASRQRKGREALCALGAWFVISVVAELEVKWM